VSGFKREVTINMLLGGACGKARGWGGTMSTMAAVGNNVPCVLCKDGRLAAATTPSTPPPSTAADDTAIRSP